ncbi:hypothetical protein [Streptomyces sp. NPDC058855]|uniref:hypothetical protein n=1 Tax=Streptomyces sp. NPDC058855 TaxID=3346651 RepID=UPI0036899FA9
MAALSECNKAGHGLPRLTSTAWVTSGRPLLEEPDRAGHVFTKVISAGQGHGEVARDIGPAMAGTMLRDPCPDLLHRRTRSTDAKASLHVDRRTRGSAGAPGDPRAAA